MSIRDILLGAIALGNGGNVIAADNNCAWQPSYVSANAKPVPVKAIDELSADLTIRELVARLGPAARDVGSGLHVFQWDVADGSVFSVSAASACTRLLGRGRTRKNV